MKVKELIDCLRTMKPDMEVYFAHPSHDYWKSELASEVEQVGDERVKYSAYHEQMATVDDEDIEDTDDRGEEPHRVVILR